MPVIFAAHGAPILLDDAAWMAELAAWAAAMPRPEAILIVSAHWEERPTTLGATQPVPLVYDFYGFPERYYQTRYPAPGAPALAARVRELLRQRDIAVARRPAARPRPRRVRAARRDVPARRRARAADLDAGARPGAALRARPRARAAARRARARVRQRLPDAQHELRVPSRDSRLGPRVRRLGRRARSSASTSTRSWTSARAPRPRTWRCRRGSTTRPCSSPRARQRPASVRTRASRSPASGWTAPSRGARSSSAERFGPPQRRCTEIRHSRAPASMHPDSLIAICSPKCAASPRQIPLASAHIRRATPSRDHRPAAAGSPERRAREPS